MLPSAQLVFVQCHPERSAAVLYKTFIQCQTFTQHIGEHMMQRSCFLTRRCGAVDGRLDTSGEILSSEELCCGVSTVICKLPEGFYSSTANIQHGSSWELFCFSSDSRRLPVNLSSVGFRGGGWDLASVSRLLDA